MKNYLIRLGLLTLVFVTALALASCGGSGSGGGSQGNGSGNQIQDLAQDIIVAQRDEIEELKAIKKEEFGASEVPMEMSNAEMEMMGMMDPEELANKEPFDKAFIDAMIPHHRSAIEMANVAYRESDNPEIRTLAETIVDAQTREIAQMTAWRREWYPEG